MNDTELQALTAIVMFERAQWEYGIQRYNEAPFDPNTQSSQALYAELERRGIAGRTRSSAKEERRGK